MRKGGGKSRFRPRYDVARLLSDALRCWQTQRNVARAAGLHEQTISNWVSGSADPEYGSILAVARVIGKTPDEYVIPGSTEGETASDLSVIA